MMELESRGNLRTMHNAPRMSLAHGNTFIIVTKRPETCNCGPYCSLSYKPYAGTLSSVSLGHKH